ncbi:hypothetical protein BaRGS_00029246 [Batillaria attramentaria]|uniref:Uncharacterized protein n=1 Tax=Batillaria attramentaria TaxID=370345 RepID=A0ABD0JXQ5_9CAEN
MKTSRPARQAQQRNGHSSDMFRSHRSSAQSTLSHSKTLNFPSRLSPSLTLKSRRPCVRPALQDIGRPLGFCRKRGTAVSCGILGHFRIFWLNLYKRSRSCRLFGADSRDIGDTRRTVSVCTRLVYDDLAVCCCNGMIFREDYSKQTSE